MDMQKLMREAQQMQEKLQKAQEGLADERLEATTGGGMITVTANGNGDILSLKIDPEAVDPEDVEMLEDMVLGAVTEAITAFACDESLAGVVDCARKTHAALRIGTHQVNSQSLRRAPTNARHS